MRIVIPTRGRKGPDDQQTWRWLSPALRARTDVVCPESEIRFHQVYRKDVSYVAQPDPDFTIAAKRAWIMQEWAARGHDKILMLDDDLAWYVRKKPSNPDDWHLRYVRPEDMDYWFGEIEKKLTPEMPHAGFGPRQGNNRKTPGWETPGRMMYSLGYYLPVVLAECELGRIAHREDMDYCLQLLRKGYPNAVCHTCTGGQWEGFSARGGCEGQRTLEASNADAHKLAELHPGFVRVVDKEYKNVPRKEVVCQWMRALEAGKLWRASQGGGTQAGA